MRLAVMGTGPFAVPMLAALLDSPHDVAALVTRPTEAAKGREKAPANPMRDLAEKRGVAVYAPASINSDEGRQRLAELSPELLVVCDYGQILAGDVLAMVPLGGVNLHASLLPQYRGAAPIQWALLNGETETGVSVIHMTPRLDAGPILAVRRTAIGREETHPELEHRLALLGVEAVREALDLLSGWDRSSALGARQDTSQATKAPRLKKEQGLIDWTRTAEQIRNQVRALQPWPGSFTFWRRAGQEALRLVIDRVETVDGASGEPGRVLVSDGARLMVATGSGGISILSLQPAGKRVMTAAEFLRGYPVRPDDQFTLAGSKPAPGKMS